MSEGEARRQGGQSAARLRVRLGAALCVPLVLSLVAWWTVPATSLQASADVDASAESVIGSRRCEQCHGRSRRTDEAHAHEAVSLDEFGRWIDTTNPDPHGLPNRDETAVQKNPFYRDIGLADIIATRLQLQEGSKSKECLACHYNPTNSHLTAADAEVAASYGLGCVSCHRSPEKWLIPHEKWREDNANDEVKRDAGYVCLNQWDVRVEACAACHIGSPPGEGLLSRNLTHDMYAAGHPWKPYEFRHYHEAMNPHWNVEFDRKKDPSYDARAWLAGQIIGAKSLVRLTKHRALQAMSNSVQRSHWPELTELDCFACHQDLGPKIGDTQLAVALDESSSPGPAPWHGNSMFPLLRRMAANGFLQDEALVHQWDALARLVAEPSADPKAVVSVANQVEERLEQLYQRIEGRADLHELLAADIRRRIQETLDAPSFRLEAEELMNFVYVVDALTASKAGDQFQGQKLFEGAGLHSPKTFIPTEASLKVTLNSLLERLGTIAPR